MPTHNFFNNIFYDRSYLCYWKNKKLRTPSVSFLVSVLECILRIVQYNTKFFIFYAMNIENSSCEGTKRIGY